MTMQERVLLRRICGLTIFGQRFAKIFFTEFVPQLQSFPLRFSEDLLRVGEERIRQKHGRHLLAKPIPHLQAPALSAGTAAPAFFKESDLSDRPLASQLV